MSNKKIYVLGILLIIIVGILLLQSKLGSKKPGEDETRILPGITDKSVSAITIKEGAAVIALRKKGDVWVVSKPDAAASAEVAAPASLSPILNDSAATPVANSAAVKEYPVDSASITTAIEKLVTLEKTTLISEKPEKQAIFEVDTAKGITVDVSGPGGKAIGSVIIGKSGSDYNSNYIRKLGSNSVYLANGGIRYSFFSDLARWRNKTIVKFDKATAQGLTLAKNDGSLITIAHADSGNPWEILQPIKNPAKTEEVESILDKLANLTATDFQDDVISDADMGFDKPELGVTVSFKNGSSRNIIFGKKSADNKFWVKVEGNEQIFMIGEYTVNQINKKLDDLKGEPLLKPLPAESLKK